MRKKLLLVSILCLIIATVIGVAADSKPTVMVAGNNKISSIKAKSRPLEMDFALSFDGVELPYSAEEKTFYLPVDMEQTQWESGELSGVFYDAAEQEDKGQQATLLFEEDYQDTDKQEAIAAGTGFSFLALTNDGYGEYRLVFTGLPMITFTPSDYLAEDGSQMFCLRLYDTDHTGEWVTECYTQARLRGNTSLTYDKKSLRLYLKTLQEDGTFQKCKENLLGLREDDDWILNALYADSTRIRDQLCVELWNEVGAGNNPYGQNFGTQSAMVEVMIGNGYQGVYDLMVPIDCKQLGMESVSEQLAAGKTVIERIYKKKYTASWNGADFIGALPDENQPDYRGGFYLKGDTVLQNEEEWQPLYELASLIEASDEEFAGSITEIADQQNLIDNWLFYQAIAGFDNENKNVYYVARNRGEQYYGYFIPWDLNLSFGAVYADNLYYCEEKASAVTEIVAWQPAQRMIELDAADSKALLQETWRAWREGAFSDEALQDRIAGLEHQIKASGAFAREDARWPEGNQEEDFSFLYDFAAERMKVIDGYIDEISAK
jgi:hypothetical protein